MYKLNILLVCLDLGNSGVQVEERILAKCSKHKSGTTYSNLKIPKSSSKQRHTNLSNKIKDIIVFPRSKNGNQE